jgi:uncharacterized membrane protein
VNKTAFSRWQANFWAGLAIVLPVVVSVSLVVWLFENVANVTDTLLIFVPRKLTHREDGLGPMYGYWSLAALGVAIILISVVGFLARNYFDKRLVEWIDSAMRRVPLVNKIYSATKQVNDAFTSNNKKAFRTVVLVEFPRVGVYTLGFVTSEQPQAIRGNEGENLVCVFVPTTPNPTGGYLLLIPEEKIRKLEMSVGDGIKYVISLGSISPETGAIPDVLRNVRASVTTGSP